MSKEELIFCPLGGSGEIGGNMNLYAYGKEDDQKWIVKKLLIDMQALKDPNFPSSTSTCKTGNCGS